MSQRYVVRVSGKEDKKHTKRPENTLLHTHLNLHSHPGNPQYLIFSTDLHHQLVTTFLLPVKSYARGENDSAGGPDGEAPAGVQQGVFERLVEAVADGVHHSH